MCVGLWPLPLRFGTPRHHVLPSRHSSSHHVVSPCTGASLCTENSSSSRQLAAHNTGTRHFWQHEALHAMASSAMSKLNKAEQCMHVTPSTFLQHCHRAARSWLSPHLLSSSEHVWGSPCGRTLPITHKRRAPITLTTRGRSKLSAPRPDRASEIVSRLRPRALRLQRSRPCPPSPPRWLCLRWMGRHERHPLQP